jgi:hypothetical protein
MERLYEVKRAAKSKARMALRAAVDPMLIRDRRTQTPRDIMMALSGMAHFG